MPSEAMRKIAWMSDAACKGLDVNMFFDTYSTTSTNVSPEVKAMCDSCSVKWECYVYAEENHLDYGVFGGLSASQRSNRRKTTGRTSRGFGRIA